MTLSVYPSVLQDGSDAVVTFANVPNPTPNDFISVACGPTLGLGDYLDFASCGYVPQNSPDPITNVCAPSILFI